MPQVFRVVRCFSCDAFQVDQKKKVNKFSCKICNEKQSVRKVYCEGTGKECRVASQHLSVAAATINNAAAQEAAAAADGDDGVGDWDDRGWEEGEGDDGGGGGGGVDDGWHDTEGWEHGDGGGGGGGGGFCGDGRTYDSGGWYGDATHPHTEGARRPDGDGRFESRASHASSATSASAIDGNGAAATVGSKWGLFTDDVAVEEIDDDDEGGAHFPESYITVTTDPDVSRDAQKEARKRKRKMVQGDLAGDAGARSGSRKHQALPPRPVATASTTNVDDHHRRVSARDQPADSGAALLSTGRSVPDNCNHLLSADADTPPGSRWSATAPLATPLLSPQASPDASSLSPKVRPDAARTPAGVATAASSKWDLFLQ